MAEEQHKKRPLSPSIDNEINGYQTTVKMPKIGPNTHANPKPKVYENSPAPADASIDNVCFSEFEEDWTDIGDECQQEQQQYTLDLTTWKRCRVLAVVRGDKQNLIVTVEDKKSKERAKCCLLSPWNTIEHIVPGLIVSVLAVKLQNQFVIDANDGMFITNPDLLISGTTVVGSLFCSRRGVLQQHFRLLGTENREMHIGTLVHSVFQQCLTDNNCRSLQDIKHIAESWIKSPNMVTTLYAYGISSDEAMAAMSPYFEEIDKFFRKYLMNKATRRETAVEPEFKIHAIQDIEENIWCHQLGIKGKIDVTVSVMRSDGMGASEPEVMPLELKTGRASYSFEHVGQLVLYEMMMNLVGHRVEGGLLLYLREGKCSKKVSDRNMRRDLILLRNEIAHHFDHWMTPYERTGGEMDAGEDPPLLPSLPEPINHERACRKCPYNTICTVMAKRDPLARELPANHGLSVITSEASGHLSNLHIDYFIRWTGIIYLEQKDMAKDYCARALWTKDPQHRAAKGWCIVDLQLISPVRMVDDRFFHTFTMSEHPESLHERAVTDGLQTGDYVICSTNNRIAVAAGYIISRVGHELVLSLERNLNVNYAGEKFHIDRSEGYKSTGFHLSNLAMLLANTDEAERCRRTIIERMKPTFAEGVLPKALIPRAKKMLQNLNRHQKMAVLKAAATESYCLLKGLPGTGKTQTIVGIIRILFALGKSILLTSNTHSAVDNVLKRLASLEELKFIRLGTLERIDPAIRFSSAAVMAEQCDTPEKLAKLYDEFKIVAVTCQGAAHPLIEQRKFDYCIVDEATQVFQSSIIRPLLQCKRFLLVGDPEQLPPVVKSKEARTFGGDESLFHRLDQEGAYCILPTQYRMNRVLTKLANDFTYDGKLVCGNDMVANNTLKLPQLSTLRQMYGVERWLMRGISNQIDLSAVMLDTGYTGQLNESLQLSDDQQFSLGHEQSSKGSLGCVNLAEVALTIYICGALLRAGVDSKSIGIMAPFRAQVDLIRQHMQALLQKQRSTRPPLSDAVQSPINTDKSIHAISVDDCDIEINTVDQFQGKDKQLILYSCTKTAAVARDSMKLEAENTVQPSTMNSNEILFDKRRLTVAITRAQVKLIVLGDRQCLDTYTPFSKLFKVIPNVGHVKLIDKKDGFEWHNLFDSLRLLTD
ncbi:DNA replication ATP-dependent helicase/nuclease DNA2 [Anopheles aquasalis]|uniref:DNA replication ATP-dependent helicase/nuclease DNA2 n=1 Tax=Anopheles aquasalis TaxID=42839 RepID=UPI00215ACC7F|nr:DNA replication ATP-dependent helicase/nuclease DNA2 [Anopheles aquasalis]